MFVTTRDLTSTAEYEAQIDREFAHVITDVMSGAGSAVGQNPASNHWHTSYETLRTTFAGFLGSLRNSWRPQAPCVDGC